MTVTTREEQPVPTSLPLQYPGKSDATWQERVEKALRARELGAQLRKDKPKSFREIVGEA